MFGKIGAGEIILILAIVLIVFGPTKLPALAKSIGQAFSEFRKSAKGIAKEFDEDLKEEASEEKSEENK
ncbi:MAG: twin-arginine translocase TatA/TatE family subunit [Oscillospiraceae bacterium]|jgi:sec-independent protein translocase protein TatA|nr:twin-arginine translocase TatA/TatE family subunit [Oscillospiraceae bacterium]MBQ5666704.1 twin-arginine translocase TatA/TatE family subunit [Oscillospiraceae bacterium]MBQ5897558.1 twin-arginine translocase TatA/TatE family subunit [Oscillospiraceae bacterium]MBQ6579303.1 twin-arginine translocase TatA/TatE family subunit [Oscillospiraceae bacterium]MBQ8788006.1 twin-arginine translocase TatA/TatE family subunit [Oscillospiraceae bacterium]